MKRTVRFGFGVVALGSMALTVWSPPATAETIGVGWWTRSAAASAPPGGIAVGNSIDGPTSVAAVLVDLGDGASSATLSLNQSGGAAPAGANIEACIIGSFTPAEGAPIEEAPATACEGASVPVAVGADGATWTADLADLVGDSRGTVGVAVVPAPGGSLFELQFETAGVTVSGGGGSSSGSSSTPTTVQRPSTASSPSPSPSPSASPVRPSTSTFTPARPPAVAAPTTTVPTVDAEATTPTTEATTEAAIGVGALPTAASTGIESTGSSAGQALGYVVLAMVIGVVGGVAHKAAGRRFAV